ncbi:MAG: hypothetical protein H6Q05_3124 [Acidobacteria bacterium]|nr:hypothetical protein [Acidobacteriota bacterium]
MGAVKNLAETIILKGQYAEADLPECSEQMPAEGEGTIRMTLEDASDHGFGCGRTPTVSGRSVIIEPHGILRRGRPRGFHAASCPQSPRWSIPR